MPNEWPKDHTLASDRREGEVLMIPLTEIPPSLINHELGKLPNLIIKPDESIINVFTEWEGTKQARLTQLSRGPKTLKFLRSGNVSPSPKLSVKYLILLLNDN